MIPAPAQGTLALELRADNAKLMAKLDALSDEKPICAQALRENFKANRWKLSSACGCIL